MNGALLFGHKDQSHAAFANLFHQFVRADECTGVFGDGKRGIAIDPLSGSRIGSAARGDGGAVQEAAGVVVCLEQSLDTAAQLSVAAAGLIEIGGAFLDRLGTGGGEDRFNAIEIGIHGEAPRVSGPIHNATKGRGAPQEIPDFSCP